MTTYQLTSRRRLVATLFFAVTGTSMASAQPSSTPYQLPANVQQTFDAARATSTFGIPRFKRISYSFVNEVLAPGFPKQANPTQTHIEILAHGELLEYRDASKSPPQLDFFALLGGMVRVKEPQYISRFVSSKCTEHEISALQANLPKVLEIGTQLEVMFELLPLPAGECPAARPIQVRCEATRAIEAKALHPAIPGRGIYLLCKANNRIADGVALYKIYLEDLGIALNLVESEYSEGRKRQITKFEIER
jgi:hypothetical protein